MVVFLDRDGVINKDSADYIKSWSEFEFLDGSIEALRLLTQKGFETIIITNQSVINRKMVSKEDLESIHAMMIQTVEAKGGRIKDIFFCPHTPEDRCSCRKPKPGMVYKASAQYKIDIANSVMVGDSAKDIECAQNAGCGRSVLVKTGDFFNAANILSQNNISPTHIAKDLFHAVKWIIAQHGNDKFTP